MFEFEKPKSMEQSKYEYLIEWFRTRYAVLLRDRCSCQNENCNYSERIVHTHEMDPETGWFKQSQLQVHHLIHREEFKKDINLAKELDYKMDDSENLVTLCENCHVLYHSGRAPLKIDGDVYDIGKERKMDFTIIKSKRKKIIKDNKHLMKPLTWEMLAILLKWMTDEWRNPDK